MHKVYGKHSHGRKNVTIGFKFGTRIKILPPSETNWSADTPTAQRNLRLLLFSKIKQKFAFLLLTRTPQERYNDKNLYLYSIGGRAAHTIDQN